MGLSPNFPCPVTLGQEEACDRTGKRETVLRVAGQRASQRGKEEGQDEGRREEGRKLVEEEIVENSQFMWLKVLAQRVCIWQSKTIERNSSTLSSSWIP